MILVLRCVNWVITIILWATWISLPSSVYLDQSIEITLVQVSNRKNMFFLKLLSFFISVMSWFDHGDIDNKDSNVLTLFQIYAGVCLILFVIIHLAIEVRNYVHKRHIQSIYNNITQDDVNLVSSLKIDMNYLNLVLSLTYFILIFYSNDLIIFHFSGKGRSIWRPID